MVDSEHKGKYFRYQKVTNQKLIFSLSKIDQSESNIIRKFCIFVLTYVKWDTTSDNLFRE